MWGWLVDPINRRAVNRLRRTTQVRVSIPGLRPFYGTYESFNSLRTWVGIRCNAFGPQELIWVEGRRVTPTTPPPTV